MLLSHYIIHALIHRVGGPDPLKKHKSIDFFSNTELDPLIKSQSYQPSIQWRANDGLLKKLVKVGPFWIHACCYFKL